MRRGRGARRSRTRRPARPVAALPSRWLNSTPARPIIGLGGSRMNRLARTDASPQHTVHFCTHCGTLSNESERRVCGRCGMGVVLSCAPGLLPREGSAFLVVKADLRISAASAAVGQYLDGDVVGEPLLNVLSADPALPRWIVRAAMGSSRVVAVALRIGPRRVNGRVAPCGAPPAALLVLG